MESTIQYTENYDISINLSLVKNSQKGYDSTIAPFFRPYEDENIDIIESMSIIPDADITNIDIMNNFSKICNHKKIQDFFINNNGIDREIYIKNWTFFSLEKILSLDEMYRESNINNIIDIGFIYHGMGWIVVAFYYIPEKKLYFRMDGGSNNFDRIDNFNKLKNIDTNIEKKIDIGLYFKDFLNIIENGFDIPSTIM